MFQILISNQRKKNHLEKNQFVYFYFFIQRNQKKKTYNDIATRTDTLTIC